MAFSEGAASKLWKLKALEECEVVPKGIGDRHLGRIEFRFCALGFAQSSFFNGGDICVRGKLIWVWKTLNL